MNRAQYPSDVIAPVVLWRLRYRLALRDLPEMFLIRGLVFSHEAVRAWEVKLTPALAEDLWRRRRGKVDWSWYVDETYLKVQGRWCYLYRATDRSGALVDVMLSEYRDMAAAKAFFRSAKAVTGVTPDRVTTDDHDSYLRAADFDDIGRAFRNDVGHQFRSKSAGRRTSRFANPLTWYARGDDGNDFTDPPGPVAFIPRGMHRKGRRHAAKQAMNRRERSGSIAKRGGWVPAHLPAPVQLGASSSG